MKHFMALVLVVATSTSYAVMIGSGNNMGQESPPKKEVSETRMEEDVIRSGQSATRRNQMDTPSLKNRPEERCIDRNGYSYSKNDSGFAACVNQNNRRMRNR